ncbi:hypothetical protein BJX96DRAFT_171286 [Aspergillus floccosus]
MAPSRPSKGDDASLKPDIQSRSASRRLFGKQMIITIIFLVLSAWTCAIWIFSSAFKQPERASNLRILVADLDGEQVGQSLVAGCASISGKSETASFVSVEDLTIPYDHIYNQVWE